MKTPSRPINLKPIPVSVMEGIRRMLDPSRDFRIYNVPIKQDGYGLDYSFINITNDRFGPDDFMVVLIKSNAQYEVEVRWEKRDEFHVCSLEEIKKLFETLKITAP